MSTSITVVAIKSRKSCDLKSFLSIPEASTLQDLKKTFASEFGNDLNDYNELKIFVNVESNEIEVVDENVRYAFAMNYCFSLYII